jgi:hypothetical protein
MGDRADENFVSTMLEIEKKFESFNRHDRIRIEKWSKKLCQVTSNPIWKKNRNAYAQLLLKMVDNQNIQEPFSKVPPEGPLPKLIGSNYVVANNPISKPRSVMAGVSVSGPGSPRQRPKQFNKPESGRLMSERRPQRQPEPPRPVTSENIMPETLVIKDSNIFETTADNRETDRLRIMLEVSQMNEKNLREELLVRARTIAEQSEQLNRLRLEVETLKA